ncbi:MAG: AAA family ATPase, partial [Methylococcaceae bacterium]
MISKLVMYNFKSVEYCEHIFPEGLIALRGRNEVGKSTRFHAILYALFGSRALPLSLAETVTYEKPDSSLKVILEFTFGGVLYHISRSKSGATLTAGTVTANGQAEVTRYVENL